MNRPLIFAAIAEGATGVALLIAPALVGQLLLGEAPTGIALVIARVAGIALIALGVACWPGPPLAGILIYTVLVMLLLAFVGVRGELVGPLLWPAAAVHCLLALLLGKKYLAQFRGPET